MGNRWFKKMMNPEMLLKKSGLRIKAVTQNIVDKLPKALGNI
jgi:hypothetical protein